MLPDEKSQHESRIFRVTDDSVELLPIRYLNRYLIKILE
nr:MAG TPA: hypothetical protein [Caudoviricetes sp.]